MRSIPETGHGPGVIGVLTGELGRYSEFFQSLDRLLVPSGTHVYWPRASSYTVAKNSNRSLMLGQYTGSEWVWLIGDDHTFEPDIILRLLAHEKDVCVPLNMHRTSPFMPVVLTAGKHGKYHNRVWQDIPTTGLIHEIDGEAILTGQPGMLVKRRVIEAIPGPYWFEFGKFVPDEPGEDLWFVKKVLEAGFQLWLDCDQVMGHSNVATMSPVRTPDGWHVDFGVGDVHLHAKIERKRIAPVAIWSEPAQRIADDCAARIEAELWSDPALSTLPEAEARRLVLERILKRDDT